MAPFVAKRVRFSLNTITNKNLYDAAYNINRPSAPYKLLSNEKYCLKLLMAQQCACVTLQISKVQEESRSLKEINASLQSRINYSDDWQMQFLSVQSKFSTFQMQYNELQSKLAAVQVENATLSSQIGSLSSQNSGLLLKLAQFESRHHADAERNADMRNILDNVEQDHDALQQLHERLSREHEALLTEHSALKAIHKDIKARLRLLSEQNSVLHREMETVAEVCFILVVLQYTNTMVLHWHYEISLISSFHSLYQRI